MVIERGRVARTIFLMSRGADKRTFHASWRHSIAQVLVTNQMARAAAPAPTLAATAAIGLVEEAGVVAASSEASGAPASPRTTAVGSALRPRADGVASSLWGFASSGSAGASSSFGASSSSSSSGCGSARDDASAGFPFCGATSVAAAAVTPSTTGASRPVVAGAGGPASSSPSPSSSSGLGRGASRAARGSGAAAWATAPAPQQSHGPPLFACGEDDDEVCGGGCGALGDVVGGRRTGAGRSTA
mmetsp:Transcript_23133/g.91776  ORF Transcript_23133/g.91776 Transcript_23133/m.91776 type:complete len:245 (+) Transcript_23133:199-933(+)